MPCPGAISPENLRSILPVPQLFSNCSPFTKRGPSEHKCLFGGMVAPTAFRDSPACVIVTLFREGYIQHTNCLCQPAKYAFTTVAQKCNTWRLYQLATNYHF